MKKNDIALIVLIASIALVSSYFLLRAVVGEQRNEAVKVEVVEPITADITLPSTQIFNANSINPTVTIEIGKPSNQQPF